MSIEAWENRYTVRKFSETNREINPEHLKYLETALNNLPYQCNIKSDVWIYLGSSNRDLEFRKWLMENIYNMYNKKSEFKEHMLPVLQAPAIMLCVKTGRAWLDGAGDRLASDIDDIANRAEGMFTGVIISTMLNFGYKVGTFRCTDGLEEYPNDKIEYFSNYIKDRYESQLAHMFQTNDPEEFEFYVAGFRHGVPPHAGWGLGVEPVLMKLTGSKNVRETVLFPRDRHRVTP